MAELGHADQSVLPSLKRHSAIRKQSLAVPRGRSGLRGDTTAVWPLRERDRDLVGHENGAQLLLRLLPNISIQPGTERNEWEQKPAETLPNEPGK